MHKRQAAVLFEIQATDQTAELAQKFLIQALHFVLVLTNAVEYGDEERKYTDTNCYNYCNETVYSFSKGFPF